MRLGGLVVQLKETPKLGKEDAHESRLGFTEPLPQGFDSGGGRGGADVQQAIQSNDEGFFLSY